MKVPCNDISRFIKDDLRQQAVTLKKKKRTPKLVTVLVGNSAEQLSNIKTKQKVAKEIGVDFELVQLKTIPSFLQFANLLKDKSQDPSTTGILLEQPLPSMLQSDTLFNFIPLDKEIEGHRKKTTFFPPIGLSILTILKYIYQNTKISNKLYPDPVKDPSFFKQSLKQKRVVLIGNSVSGGLQIAKALSQFRVNFINVNSQTFEPEQYYREADIIITAANAKVIYPEQIKQGVVLINVGQHEEKKEIVGDYDDNEIKSVASFYTPSQKGMLSIDVLFLFKNLIDAAKLQYA